MFKNIGEYEELISTIKALCADNVVVSVLLHDSHIDEAVERALSSPYLSPMQLMKVAETAERSGREEEARKLVLLALKRGQVSAGESVKDIIKFFVEHSNEDELKEAIDHIGDVSMARTSK